MRIDRKRTVGAVVISIAIALFALTLVSCGRDLAKLPPGSPSGIPSGIPPDIRNTLSVPLPVFVSPIQDGLRGNGLFAVAGKLVTVDDKTIKAEITILFRDEDYPNKFLDFIYDIYRSFRWGRVNDVETIFVTYSKDASGLYQAATVDFPDDYAGDQRFYEEKVKHLSGSFQAEQFNNAGDRIVIYITTWNHMFSYRDNSPKSMKQVYDDYPVFAGSRADVEALYGRKTKQVK